MENSQTEADSVRGKRTRWTSGIIMLALTLSITPASANDTLAGIIDEPAASVGVSEKDRQKQVKKEQKALEKESRNKVKNRAEKGERLAQVVIGNDFAAEAQQLTFAPIAANAALSDALKWFTIAAKRGYPGALSLDTAGVSFYPLRVVRNK